MPVSPRDPALHRDGRAPSHIERDRHGIVGAHERGIGGGQGGWRDDVLNYYPSDAGI